MCGRETLAMLVSSTSMNVASVTTSAIAQGLRPPVQPVAKYAARAGGAGGASIGAATSEATAAAVIGP
jgi:hypothetical protein